jgi:hypothetical protein
VTAEVAGDRNESENESVRSDTASLSEVTPLSEVTEPLSEVTSPEATDGKKKPKRPRDPLLAIARDGKAVDVAEVAQLVDDAFFDRLPPPTESDEDEPPEDEPETGQQTLPEFAAQLGEEATAPSKDATKLATKLVVFWGARSGRPRVRVTPDRLRMVKARLQEGYTQDDLHRAIAGVCYSPFHREGGHDTIEVAIRRAEQVEKGIRLWSLHAPIRFIAGYEQRTGIKIPERAEELATYYRREASKARAAEREKEAEQREKEREGEGQTGEPRRQKTAEELFAAAFKRREEKHENEKRKRRIEVLRVEIELAKEYNEKEGLAKLEGQLEELLKKQDQERRKTMNDQ